MTKLFHGRLYFMIIVPEWKKWQETLKFEKRSPPPLISENILASPETTDGEKQMSQLGPNPEGSNRKRKESGSCLVKQPVCLVKSSWPVWRLPPLLWLAWPPQDRLSKGGMASAWDFTWHWRQKLEVDLEYILRRSKAQYSKKKILEISRRKSFTYLSMSHPRRNQKPSEMVY